MTINKAATGENASALFQNNYSVRAEIGLCGDDDFSFKVSPDGWNYHKGLHIAAGSGAVGVGGATPSAARGPLGVLATPGKATLFAQDASISLAANATLDFENFSGLIIAFNTISGGIGVFVVGGANVLLISSAGSGYGAFSFATSPNRYVFTNTGSTIQTFQFLALSGRGEA